MYIAHACIYVNDQERAKKFYCDTLGWEVRDDVPMGDTRWLSVVPPGAKTGLVLMKGFGDWSPEKVGGDTGIALEVDDVFVEAERLKAAGVAFSREPETAFFGGHAMIKDSEGNELLLHSAAPVNATH
jgi:predicted enzyme related to lactoylglutathione lyase